MTERDEPYDEFDALIESGMVEPEFRFVSPGDDSVPMPHAEPRPGGDLGFAGSLIQARNQVRRDRYAHLGSPWRDPTTLICAVVIALAVAGFTASVITQDTVVNVGTLLTALIAGLSVTVLIHRYLPSKGEQHLARQITAEVRAGNFLASALTGTGWVLLHDRRLPHTEHRVPFLAAGPGGLAIISMLPPGPYQVLQPTGVLAGDDELTHGWMLTRLWETRHLVRELAGHGISQGVGFAGPVLSLAVEGYPRASKVPTGWSAVPPHRIDDYQIRTPSGLAHFLCSLPGRFAPPHVAGLARLVDEQCPPAPRLPPAR